MERKKWEYRVFKHDMDVENCCEIKEKLNELGQDGWELVGHTIYPWEELEVHYFILKRELT